MIRDVKDIEESTLWEDTGRQIASKKKAQGGQSWVVLLLGDKTTGKSALLKVLKKQYEPDSKDAKSSQLIEFSYTQMGNEKHSLQLYQVGHRSLVPFIRKFKSQRDRVICLVCLDATKGGQLVETAGWYLNQIREAFGKGECPSLVQKRSKHQDRQLIQAMPVLTGLVGCKWDLFEKLSSDQRNWVSRGLRYMAHTNSCSLMSCSSKNSKTGNELRNSFETCFLGNDSGIKSSKEAAKPIFVQFGEDQVGEMKLPTMGNLSGLEAVQEELWRVCGKEQPAKEEEEQLPIVDGAIEEAVRAKRKGLSSVVHSGMGKTSGEIALA